MSSNVLRKTNDEIIRIITSRAITENDQIEKERIKQEFNDIEQKLKELILAKKELVERAHMEQELVKQEQAIIHHLDQERAEILKELATMKQYINKRNNQEERDQKLTLVKWLKHRCAYSDDVFEDPGYSNLYKSEFNIHDKFKKFYVPGDIDHELNMNCIDNGNEHDTYLEQFIDYVPIDVSDDVIKAATLNKDHYESIDIVNALSHQRLLILPGSNHSNANYLFKRLTRYLEKTTTTTTTFSFTPNMSQYNIPFVSADHTVSYEGSHKTAKMEINKEQFYEFLRSNSQT